jgi:hypothetical protein
MKIAPWVRSTADPNSGGLKDHGYEEDAESGSEGVLCAADPTTEVVNPLAVAIAWMVSLELTVIGPL